MTKLLSVFLALAFHASVSTAETIFVRSGEHQTFTRLVMKLPRRAEWSVSVNDGSADLVIGLPEVAYDTRQVFSRIPRTRLTGLSQTGKGQPLVMELGCDCEIESFTQSGTYLVVDIKDGTAKSEQQDIRRLPLTKTAYRFGHLNSRVRNAAAPAFKLPVVNFPVSIDGPATLVVRPTQTTGSPERPPLTSLNLSEDRLLRQINRAANQGLLTPVIKRETDDTDYSVVGQAIRVPNEPPDTPAINIRASTAVDRDMPGIAAELTQLAQTKVCSDPSHIALADWGDDREFAQQISDRRGELYGEFDRLNEDAIETLARTYLYFGFGAEAQDVLSLSSKSGKDRKLLQALASLMDGDDLVIDNPFAGQHDCKSDVALFAVLAEPEQASQANSDLVMQAFVRLPAHLRSHLGPRMGRIFNDAGETELAASILRAIDRTETTAGPELTLAAAEIDNAGGNPEAAVAKMSDVAESQSESAPQALVALVETHWTNRLAIQPDLPELAGSYAMEYRKSDLGADLRRAHAVALALSGRFDEANSVLADISIHDGPSGKNAALTPVTSLLTENANDVSFLKHTLVQLDDIKAAVSVDIGDQIARRLLDLGFPEQALSILTTPSARPASVTRRMMRAEAALAMDLPHRAMVELLSLTGPEASRLRATAMSRNGDFQLAGQALIDADLTEDAARGFWLGDNWGAISEDQVSQYGHVARVSSQLTNAVPEQSGETPLAAARALLAESQSARDAVSELLTVTGTTNATN